MLTHAAPDAHVFVARVVGTLSTQDVDVIAATIEQMLAVHERIGILIDISELADVEPRALARGARCDARLLDRLHAIPRIAVLTDSAWPGALTALSRLLPPVTLQLFAVGRREEAIRWASALPDLAGITPAIRLLPAADDAVLAFEIDGVVSAEGVSGIVAEAEAKFDRHMRVRALARITRLEGVDPSSLTWPRLAQLKLAALRQIERYAVVGAPEWMNRMLAGIAPLAGSMEIRTFPLDREQEAWQWLEARTTA